MLSLSLGAIERHQIFKTTGKQCGMDALRLALLLQTQR